MSHQWRLFLAALRFVMLRSTATSDSHEGFPPVAATRFVPLAGLAVGLAGAAVYWAGAQWWPTSVAVMLSMLVTVEARFGGPATLYRVLFILVKYNALMALSTARVPFALPDDLTLGLIMVAGQASSRALAVSVMATELPVALRMSTPDLGIALMIGLVPAAVLGIPGLIGLAAALVVRLGQSAFGVRLHVSLIERLDLTQNLAEICFYLGALAGWKYV